MELNEQISRIRNIMVLNEQTDTDTLFSLKSKLAHSAQKVYDEGEKFFNNLVENGFLEKIHLIKKKDGRALNLFMITDMTKNINI